MAQEGSLQKIETGQPIDNEYFYLGGSLREAKHIPSHQMDAIYRVAYSHFSAGHYLESVKVFRYLALLDHHHYAYLLGFGASLKELQQYAQAIEILKHAVTLEGADPRASVCMARCLIGLKRMTEAKAAIQDAQKKGVDSHRWSDLHPQVERMRTILT